MHFFQQLQSTLFIASAFLLATVKGDYVLSSYYYSKDICTAADATPKYATIATAVTSACASLGTNVWGKAACNANGGVDVSVYTNKDCTGTPSVSKNDATTCATQTFGTDIQSQTCVTGTFKAPMPIASSSMYTDDKCTTPYAAGYSASIVTVYPLDKCSQVDATTSQMYKCVGGSPTLVAYKGLKCTGDANSVTFPGGKCVSAGSGQYMKWEACASSGAASTSVTFLALGLLVLATFSSAM